MLLDRPAGDDQGGRDPGVGAALGHQGEHLALARGQRGQALGVAAGAEELADHLGVEGGAAGGDPGQRVGELGHVGDPVLEQVADAGGAALQQLGRVPGLDVLGEHQHAGPGMPAAELEGGAQALVGVGRRHADVHHGDVGTVLGHGGEQGVAVGHGGAHLVAAVLEEPDQPLAHQGGVLGDHDPHGRHALTRAAAARR